MSTEQTLNHNNAQGTENISSQIDYSNGNPMNLSYANIKMIEAFGVPLTNSDGKERVEKIEKIWERSAWLRGKMYRVPGGALGRYFTTTLAKEVAALADGEVSEKASMFGKIILQKDKKIVKTSDIR